MYYLASALKCTLFNINLSIMKKKKLTRIKENRWNINYVIYKIMTRSYYYNTELKVVGKTSIDDI